MPVKKVLLTLDNEQYEKLVKQKGELTWVNFVMKLAENDS